MQIKSFSQIEFAQSLNLCHNLHATIKSSEEREFLIFREAQFSFSQEVSHYTS